MEQSERTYMARMLDAFYPHGQPVINAEIAPLQSDQLQQTSMGSEAGQSSRRTHSHHSEHTSEGRESDQYEHTSEGCESDEPEIAQHDQSKAKKVKTPKRTQRPSPALASDGKIKCWVYKGTIQPSRECAKKISQIFVERLEPAIYWSRVSSMTKEFYWGEFKKYFSFTGVNEATVKSAWKKKANERYRDLLGNARRNRVQKKIVEDEVWNEWKAQWNTNEYKERAKINSKNRNSANGPVRHGNGSVSFTERAEALAKTLGRPPYPHEVFLATHMSAKDSKKFIDERARLFYEKYCKIRAEKLEKMEGNLNESDMMRFETEVYMEAVGEGKGYIYGLGSEVVNYAKQMSHSFANESTLDATQSWMQEEVQRLVKEQVHQHVQEQVVQEQFQQQVREQVQQHLLQLQQQQFFLPQQQLPQQQFGQQQFSQQLQQQFSQQPQFQQQFPHQQQFQMQLPPPHTLNSQPLIQQAQLGSLSNMIAQQQMWRPQGSTIPSLTPNPTLNVAIRDGNPSSENSLGASNIRALQA